MANPEDMYIVLSVTEEDRADLEDFATFSKENCVPGTCAECGAEGTAFGPTVMDWLAKHPDIQVRFVCFSCIRENKHRQPKSLLDKDACDLLEETLTNEPAFQDEEKTRGFLRTMMSMIVDEDVIMDEDIPHDHVFMKRLADLALEVMQQQLEKHPEVQDNDHIRGFIQVVTTLIQDQEYVTAVEGFTSQIRAFRREKEQES